VVDLTGQIFAGYEIIGILGKGGMGIVYKARQPILDRIVAIKVMAAHFSGDEEFVARFLREAATAARLNHRNMVQIYTAGEEKGVYYIVMEFVDGVSLQKHIANRGRIDPREAISITISVAQALQHAWNEARVVHRDVKPANVFLSKSGEIKVGDLGLAKSMGAEVMELTDPGTAIGSPHYISPEQAQSAREVDFRADIYSLGCVLYQMLTGRRPYDGETSMAVIIKHVNEPPPEILGAQPDCPVPLAKLAGKMLAKNRNDRPQSYEELIAELITVRRDLSDTSKDSVSRLKMRPARKKISKGTLAVVACALGLMLVGGFLNRSYLKYHVSRMLRIGEPPDSMVISSVPVPTEADLKPLGSVYTNTVSAEMVYIPSGECWLGSTKKEQAWAVEYGLKEQYVKWEGEVPRKATIKRGFWMGRTELTIGQWKPFIAETGYVTDAEKKGEAVWTPHGGNGSGGSQKGASWRDPGFGFAIQDNHPVCCVSWNDARAFCEWLNKREQQAGHLPPGYKMRLPTEVEWEYACRAGRQTKFWWGDWTDESVGRLNWAGKRDGFEFVAPVDSYGARGRNRFGLADMLGNVQEWCLDGFDPLGAHAELFTTSSSIHVVRGGSFYYGPSSVRCARREGYFPTDASSRTGFRVVCAP
jgi:serine/threonine protein kinase